MAIYKGFRGLKIIEDALARPGVRECLEELFAEIAREESSRVRPRERRRKNLVTGREG